MTESPPIASNPFALMMDPEAVLRAVEQSQKLPEPAPSCVPATRQTDEWKLWR